MNYLGIDYGTRRIGLSIGDDELSFAVSLPCLHVHIIGDIFEEIKKIVELRKIDKIIVGYPFNMDGSVGYKAKEVDEFIEKLNQYVAISIERVDERLTSESVGDLRHRSGKNRRRLRRSGTVDSAAAVIILQDYFDKQNV